MRTSGIGDVSRRGEVPPPPPPTPPAAALRDRLGMVVAAERDTIAKLTRERRAAEDRYNEAASRRALAGRLASWRSRLKGIDERFQTVQQKPDRETVRRVMEQLQVPAAAGALLTPSLGERATELLQALQDRLRALEQIRRELNALIQELAVALQG